MVRYLKRAAAVAILGFGLAVTAPTAGAQAQPSDQSAKAIFGGGCFWCMEPPFDKLAGVISTTSGYIGGRTPNPTYEQVSGGGTGHVEVVQIVFDPSKVTYEKLLDVFWQNVDPLDATGQFCDRGDQYRTGIFYQSDDQQRLAAQSKIEVASRLKQQVATQIVAAGRFYPAEAYHQDYYETNPVRYKFYRWNCGRDARLEELWGKPSTRR